MLVHEPSSMSQSRAAEMLGRVGRDDSSAAHEYVETGKVKPGRQSFVGLQINHSIYLRRGSCHVELHIPLNTGKSYGKQPVAADGALN